MPKAVAGYLGYDKDADRPAVKLASGTKKVLVEGDAGGGGAHASTHENGGGDEISVAGLAGVLAQPQRADTITTPGGDADVTGTTGSNGDVLTSDGAGNWSMQAPAGGGGGARPCSYCDLPVSAHADDEEFDGTTVPTSISVFASGAALPTTTYDTVPPSADISFDVAIAGATGVKVQVNHPFKPSHLVIHTAPTATPTLVVKQFTLGTRQTFRLRWSAAKLLGEKAWSGSEIFAGVWKDVSGRPDYNGDSILMGFSVGNFALLEGTSGFGYTGIVSTGFDPFRPAEYVFVSDSTLGGGNNFYSMIRTDQMTQAWHNHAPASLYTPGLSVWVGLFIRPSTGVEVIASLDYLRRQDNKDVF